MKTRFDKIKNTLLLHGYDFPNYYKLNQTYYLLWNDINYYVNSIYCDIFIPQCMHNLRKHFIFSDGKLSDIKIRQEFYLKMLHLSRNKLYKIEMLNAPDLEYLFCGENNLKSLYFLTKTNFELLEYLSIPINRIEHLDILGKISLPNLKFINLIDNPIKDFSPLLDLNTKNLENIFLSKKSIPEKIIEKLKIRFPNLVVGFY